MSDIQTSAMLIEKLRAGRFWQTFDQLYPDCAQTQAARYCDAVCAFEAHFGSGRAAALFSSPGRTELGGNHTDHQHGRVLAAAVTLDMLAVASPNDRGEIKLVSKGYGTQRITLNALEARPDERGASSALIRGVAARLFSLGYAVGGFDAYITSDVPAGSGLSSSAAFEVLLGTIFSYLYNNGAISPVTLALVAQYAENTYFGKPSGLMDQLAVAVGGVSAMDFRDPAAPVVTALACDPASSGHTLCLVETGGSHADLTADYAAIPQDMMLVANALGADFLREVDPARFYAQLGQLRAALPDRALLRAMHFFAENDRAARQAAALQAGDFPEFLALVRASGRSSQELLQNIYPSGAASHQGIALALALCAHILGERGAFRVHGGGFAGTILALVPADLLQAFQAQMESVFGTGTCMPLALRPTGAALLQEN
jgi:galactokinase